MPRTITPRKPSNGLFSVAAEAPAADVDWQGNGWGLATDCPSGGLFACADTDSNTDKATPSDVSGLQFVPFMAYQVARCVSGAGRVSAMIDEVKGFASQWLETNIEGWVTAGLELGGPNHENTGLIDLVDITGSSVIDLYDSISFLLRNRTRLGMFDRPTIHLPSWSAPQVLRNQTYLEGAADLAFGPGYGVADSVTIDDHPEQAWIYITGPVEYALLDGPDMDESFTERRQNFTYAQNEKMAVVRFDPCGGFKILAAVT